MMVVVQLSDDGDQPSSPAPLELFPVTSKVQGNDLATLIRDFFDWLETAWQLPVYTPEITRMPLPPALPEGLYTVQDLAHLYGYCKDHIHSLLQRSCIFPFKHGKGGQYSLYR